MYELLLDNFYEKLTMWNTLCIAYLAMSHSSLKRRRSQEVNHAIQMLIQTKINEEKKRDV